METPTLEKLPRFTFDEFKKIHERLNSIEGKISPLTPPSKPKYMDIQGLRNHVQDRTGKKPAKQTIYGWVANRTVPYTKFGKELRFEAEKIDAWIDNGRQISHLKEE